MREKIGATDLTGLETPTESTKETSYITSSYVSDYDKTTPDTGRGMGEGASHATGVSMKECCEQDALSRAEDGTSTMECCEEATSHMGDDGAAGTPTVSYAECCQEGTEGDTTTDFSKSRTPDATEKYPGGKPGTGDETDQQALKRHKLDCGCQATPQAEQSCQCCECKDVGVSTSNETETLTDDMVKPGTLERIPEGTELEESTADATRDFAEAGEAASGQLQGTTDEISTLHDGPSSNQDGQEYKNKRGKTVRDTQCACSDGSDEDLSTAERAAQCECFGPVERDDRSEGRLSSGSESDRDTSGKKKSKKGKSAQRSESGTFKGDGPYDKPKSKRRGSKEDDKGKSKRKDDDLTASSESIVDGEDASGKRHRDPKKPQKKRSPSQNLQNVECDCPGICQCVVCSPKIIAQRRALTGSPEATQEARPCWCTPQPMAPPPGSTAQPQASMGQRQGPMGQFQGPMGQSQMPMGTSQVPMGQSQMPMGASQMPMGQSQGPMGQSQIPMGQSQIPMGQSRGPIGQSQGPMGQPQMSMGQSQMPMGASQMPMGSSQMPMGQSQMPMGASQMPMGQSQGPMGQSQIPMGQSRGPMGQSQGPMAQQQASRTPYQPGMTPQIIQTVGNASLQVPSAAYGRQHPPGCQCVNCLCNPCTPCPPQYGQEKFLGSTNLATKSTDRKGVSVNDVFKTPEEMLAACNAAAECQKPERTVHPPNCECVDCLCIRRIAELKEHPIIRDEKQVYQVKCFCENTRKPLSVSRIPIATNSTTSTPKAKSVVSCTCDECKCSPCSDTNKSVSRSESHKPTEGGATTATTTESTARTDLGSSFPGLKMTASELSKLCDCKNCECSVCFNKLPGKQGATVSGTGDPSQTKASAKNCCCKGECICGACPVDQLARQAAAGGSPAGRAKGASSDHPDDCDCTDCFCPYSTAKSGSDLSMDEDAPPSKTQARAADSKLGKHLEGCTCSECVCPGKDAALQATGDQSRIAGCTCPGECVCPGKEAALRATGDQSKVEGCDCPICSCPGIDMVRKTLGPGAQPQSPSMPVIPEKSAIADCDCVDCQCNPCADPKKRKPGSLPIAIAPCDCEDCKCEPCADPSKRKGKGDAQEGKGEKGVMVSPGEGAPLTTSAAVGSTENRATHPPDCICEECLCHPDEKHEIGCNCPECKCVDCYSKRFAGKPLHGDLCRCEECICSPCDKKREDTSARGSGEARSAPGGGEATSTPGGKDTGLSDSCTCAICQCTDCFHKSKTKKTCTCADCICVDCPNKEGQGKPTTISEKEKSVGVGGDTGVAPSSRSATAPPPPAPLTHKCHCVQCTCDICTTPVVQQDGRPKGCTCEVCQCADCGGLSSTAASVGKECTCVVCQCDDCQSKRKEESAGAAAATFSAVSGRGDVPSSAGPHPDGCTCNTCICNTQTQDKSTSKPMEVATSTLTDPPPFEVPVRIPCTCGKCGCEECTKRGTAASPATGAGAGEAKRAATGGSPGVVPPATAEAPPFEVPVRKPCTCGKCDCEECNKQPTVSAGVQPSVSFAPGKPGATQTGFGVETAVSASAPSTVATAPTTVATATKICTCPECDCTDCTKHGAHIQTTMSAPSSVHDTVPKSSAQTVTSPPLQAKATETNCICSTCTCPDIGISKQPQPKSTPAISLSAVSSKPAERSTMTNCECPTCACPDDSTKATATAPSTALDTVTSKSTGLLDKEMVQVHPEGCICPECCLCESKVGTRQSKKDDTVNEEITSISKMDNETLRKKIQTDKQENCKCKEQIKEIRRALDKIKCSCTEAEMKAIKSTTPAGGGKPFVKQASVFGQTMSGLKFALTNLQQKCKAKDKLIEAMTGELKMRTSSNTFDKVLATKAITDVPDYDDVQSLDRPPDNTTNVLFAHEEKEIGHTSVRHAHRHRKRSKVCKCGKQHKDKDNANVDLSGFEVVDIRRITQDSIIIKWKPPQSNLINGYDIFINGVNKSKVMSGGRTSAMVHSLDLSSTIQITIYAVTKCGRCEPPAIAIYEINT